MGASAVLSLQKKRGGRKSFSHAEGGGGTTSFEVVQELQVVAILLGVGGGGCKKLRPFKRGGA